MQPSANKIPMLGVFNQTSQKFHRKISKLIYKYKLTVFYNSRNWGPKSIQKLGDNISRKALPVLELREFLWDLCDVWLNAPYEVLSLGNHRVEPCRGCWACMKTGQCIRKTDALPEIAHFAFMKFHTRRLHFKNKGLGSEYASFEYQYWVGRGWFRMSYKRAALRRREGRLCGPGATRGADAEEIAQGAAREAYELGRDRDRRPGREHAYRPAQGNR